MIVQRIKSFVLRTGRMSPRQQLGLDEHYSKYALPQDDMPWNFSAIFSREAPTRVEIGFGMGHSLLEMAKTRPDINFIGIEVHLAGVGALASDLAAEGLTNVRLIREDAVSVFEKYIPDQSLDGIQIFFPDPWPKKRHHKRRLIQSPFVSQLTDKINDQGFLHCATDWEAYALHIKSVLDEEPQLKGGYVRRPNSRPLTKFERRGQDLGHGVWDLLYHRTCEKS